MHAPLCEIACNRAARPADWLQGLRESLTAPLRLHRYRVLSAGMLHAALQERDSAGADGASDEQGATRQ